MRFIALTIVSISIPYTFQKQISQVKRGQWEPTLRGIHSKISSIVCLPPSPRTKGVPTVVALSMQSRHWSNLWSRRTQLPDQREQHLLRTIWGELQQRRVVRPSELYRSKLILRWMRAQRRLHHHLWAMQFAALDWHLWRLLHLFWLHVHVVRHVLFRQYGPLAHAHFVAARVSC